ncbi:MAG: PASTA domain-containing protein [Endomicrobium sp.]|jgi:serine/threonine-protein kinase|nr:PASTA domain-containing protein [Endomicrobium sp.]
MKTFIKILILFFVFGAACYYSFNMVMSALIHSEEEIVLPDVKGKNIVEAVEELSALGLGLRKESEEFNQSVPPGVVLRQSPPSGMNVRKGKVIKVAVSQGGEMIYVPNLVGQTVRAADIVLKSSILMTGEISKQYSVTAAKGIVISQDPPAGSSVEKDAVINLVVSDGNPPEGVLLMPDWINKNIDDAKEWALQNELSFDIRNEKSQNLAANAVIRQSPAPDSLLNKSVKIIFYSAVSAKEKNAEEKIFNYKIPAASGNKRVQLVLIDDNGEKIILNAVKKPGTQISMPLQPAGAAFVKVYINKKFIEDVPLN